MDSLQEATTNFAVYLQNNGIKILISVVIFFVAIKIIKQLLKFLANTLSKKGIEKSIAEPIVSFTKYVSYFILIIILASFLGIDTTSLFMILILLVIVIVVAMQTTLANIGAGLMLMIIKPFHVGNYVEINQKEGNVKDINLYHTIITQRDNSVVFVPNSEVLNTEIINMEKNRKRRVDIDIYVSSSSDFSKLRKVALNTTAGDKRILPDPKSSFIVNEIEPYGIEVRTRLWVKKTDYWDVLFEYNEKILSSFKDADVKFPEINVSYSPNE